MKLTTIQVKPKRLYCPKLKPMYNTLLKSYEKYKYICLDEKDHNIIKITNEIEEDGIYFGPYSFKRKLDIIKEIIIKVYRLPICKRQNKCIRYDLNKCIGVCRGNIENDKRLDIVENIKDNLNGKSNFVIESLKKEMNGTIKTAFIKFLPPQFTNCSNKWPHCSISPF